MRSQVMPGLSIAAWVAGLVCLGTASLAIPGCGERKEERQPGAGAAGMGAAGGTVSRGTAGVIVSRGSAADAATGGSDRSRTANAVTLPANVRSSDATHFEIDHDVIAQLLLHGVAGDIGLAPAPTGAGFVLLDVAPGSLLARLGLATGDVVRSANGVVLVEGASLLAAYADVKQRGELLVIIERGGTALGLEYRVRATTGPDTASVDPTALAPDAGSPESKPASPGSARIKRIDDFTYEVGRDVLDKITTDSTLLARQVRIVPALRDGKPSGFKLYALRDGSLWTLLGFQNGDTVQEVNGLPMTTPDRALEVYAKLRAAKRITVALERRGTVRKIEYTIVD